LIGFVHASLEKRFYENASTVRKEAFMHMFKTFWRDQSGATSIEYAIMASCIAVAIVAAVTNLGSKVASSYTSVNVALK
jgi:pilus assembly protein Flp/PilA